MAGQTGSDTSIKWIKLEINAGELIFDNGFSGKGNSNRLFHDSVQKVVHIFNRDVVCHQLLQSVVVF